MTINPREYFSVLDVSKLTDEEVDLLQADVLAVAAEEYADFDDPENAHDLAEAELRRRIGGQEVLWSYVDCLVAGAARERWLADNRRRRDEG